MQSNPLGPHAWKGRRPTTNFSRDAVVSGDDADEHSRFAGPAVHKVNPILELILEPPAWAIAMAWAVAAPVLVLLGEVSAWASGITRLRLR